MALPLLNRTGCFACVDCHRVWQTFRNKDKRIKKQSTWNRPSKSNLTDKSIINPRGIHSIPPSKTSDAWLSAHPFPRPPVTRVGPGLPTVLGCSLMEVPDSAGGNRVMFMQDHPLSAYLA